VPGIGHVLELTASFPPFRDARQWVLRNLGIGQGSAVLEGGCGNGIAIGEVLDIVGPKGRIVGIDPTEAFIEAARTRAVQLKAGNAQYEVGDIRKLPYRTNEFDAAFCDKVLIRAGPPRAALANWSGSQGPKAASGSSIGCHSSRSVRRTRTSQTRSTQSSGNPRMITTSAPTSPTCTRPAWRTLR
jgi:SAM-dependent methyltransferase